MPTTTSVPLWAQVTALVIVSTLVGGLVVRAWRNRGKPRWWRLGGHETVDPAEEARDRLATHQHRDASTGAS